MCHVIAVFGDGRRPRGSTADSREDAEARARERFLLGPADPPIEWREMTNGAEWAQMDQITVVLVSCGAQHPPPIQRRIQR